ncbi:MAG: 3-methyladenine DNA glycosylase AlkD [Paraglaciecola sp.]|jgi:3-methyladenine DNA glycosylase AlkD
MFKPADMTENLMKIWVKTFENWETCDSFCMRLFANSVFAQKNTGNDVFKQFLPLIVTETIDDSLYVKKAVNWALRNIGKRNCDLNIEAIIIAKSLSGFESKSVKWIASNALIEL